VREVARNDKVVVFFPTEPAVLGHCMVIPCRHVEEFTALTSDEVSAVMTSAQAVAMSLRETQHPDGINIIQSNGEAATQTVPHVHVHIVPRWDGDAFREIWPSKTNFSDEEKDRVLAKLRATTLLPDSSVTPEDRRQHLSFAQNVISRMAQSSSNTKSWLLPVVTAAYGYSLTKCSVALALLGIVATVVFAFLDVGYLRTERKYRDLYERIAASDPDVPPYSLNYQCSGETWRTRFLEYCSVIKGWAIWPFYGTLLICGLASLGMALLRGH